GGYSLDINMEEHGAVPVLWVADKENTKFKKQPDENAILKAAQLYLGKQRGMSRCTVSRSAERLKTAIWREWIVQFGCPPVKLGHTDIPQTAKCGHMRIVSFVK